MEVLVFYTFRMVTRPWAERPENRVLFPAEEQMSFLHSIQTVFQVCPVTHPVGKVNANFADRGV
jgi:hypothetical protein